MVHNKDRLVDQNKRSFAVTHNLKGNTIAQWVKQYKENETHRLRNRIDSVKLTHEILSWHKDDAKNISLEKMEAMAREYIQKRNPRGIYVAIPHFDKSHYHVHICASGVEYKTGKSLRLSKIDLQKLKVDIQNYQKEKFPELSKSVVEHGKKDENRLTEKEYQLKLRTGRETEKEKLTAALKTCYKKSNSRETFFQLLKECGIKTYERGGKITGVVSDDKKFRFNRLGYTEDRLLYLDRSIIRESELKEMRRPEFKETRGRELTESRDNDDDKKIIDQDEKKNDENESSRQDELNEIRNGGEEKSEVQELEK